MADDNSTASLTSLKAKLNTIFKSEPDSIQKSQFAGMYEVIYGTEVVYISKDGKYFLSGNLINTQTRENISERVKNSIRKTLIVKKDNKPIVFKAKNEKHKITVFTDIDCPYCTKLHREVPALIKKALP